MIKSFTITAAVASLAALNAQAGETPQTINDWVSHASSAIEAKMEYPETAAMVGDIGTNTFAVTVNRQGDILDITKHSKAKRTYFDSASYKALRYVELPDLPTSYKKDKLTFVLVLDYIQNERDLALLHGPEEKQPKFMFAQTVKQEKEEEKTVQDSF